MKQIFGAIVALALLFLVVQFSRFIYSPSGEDVLANNQNMQVESHNLIPATLTIVVSDAQKKMGEETKGLNIGAAPLRLVRPVGEIISTALLSTGQKNFESVRLVTDEYYANTRDIILRSNNNDVFLWLETWAVGKKTGFGFKGLPMLIGTGQAYVTLSVKAKAYSYKTGLCYFEETEKGILKSALMLFPAPRISATMTDATNKAASVISDLIIKDISSRYTKRLKQIKKSIESN